MNFKDYVYRRPDKQAVIDQFREAKAALQNLASADEVIAVVTKVNAFRDELATSKILQEIRFTMDTNDPLYAIENDFWNDFEAIVWQEKNEFYLALSKHPQYEAVKEAFPKTFFAMIENELLTYDEKLVPLKQKENGLKAEYQQLRANAKVVFRDQEMTLPQVSAYIEDADEATRKEARMAVDGFYESEAEAFDRIYDEMVALRHEMALETGFDNYQDLSFKRMNRFDYNPEMVAKYRQMIVDHVVPFTAELFAKQAERIGKDKLAYYDTAFKYPDGNAKPLGTEEDLVKKAAVMYHEMSDETDAFFNMMVEDGLLDLSSRPGKMGGGYCEIIPDYERPFIFANFNGTSADVDVLTHEAGHAYQVYSSRHNRPLVDLAFPTNESAEIHSMAMEFLTYPWMPLFFGAEQVNKYYESHLADGFIFLPYGALVDHFQEEVYLNPEMTAEERRAMWRKLERIYCPHLDYSESPFLESGAYWFRQLHIFTYPFYYIDYTLAQVVALQFWRRAIVERDDKAFADYQAICKVGGTKTFLELVALANMASPFEDGVMASLVEAARAKLL